MTNAPKLKSKWLIVLLKVACTVALLGLLLWKCDLRDVSSRLGRLSPAMVLALCAYYAGCQLLASVRWQLLLKAKGFVVPLGRLYRFFLIGTFFNSFLPTGLGGDAVKAFYLYKDTGKGEESVVSVFLDRFVGLIGMGLISLAALPFADKVLGSGLALWVVCLSAAALVLMVFGVWVLPRSIWLTRITEAVLPHALHHRVQRVATALDGYRDCPRTLLSTVALSVVLQLLLCYYYVLVARGLQTPIPLLYFLLFLPAINLVSMLPISLGGLGVREAVMVALFQEVGVPGAEAMAISLTVYLLSVVFSVPTGLLLLFFRARKAERSPDRPPLFGRLRRALTIPFTLDRFRYLVGAAAVVLMVTAFSPWSQAPSTDHSYIDGAGKLILTADVHWTECLVRSITYLAGVVFLGVAIGLFKAGPRMTSLGWILAACLLAFAPWTAEFAPDQFNEKEVLYREMNRVIDDVERNYSQQRTDWRSGQSFSHELVQTHPGASSANRQIWTISLFAPHRWWEAFETVLGYTHEFFAFFRPKLMAELLVGTTILLIGLHLGDGRGLAGLSRGVALGCGCALFLFAIALVPRTFGEYLMVRADDAWTRGDQSQSVTYLQTASFWRPDLSRLWWYHAQLGRAAQLRDNPNILQARLSDAYDDVMDNQADEALEILRRAQALQPTDPVLRRCLACGLAEAGLRIFDAGQYSMARQVWEESLSLVPTNPLAWYGLSLFYLRMKNFDDCARCLDQLVRLESFFGYQRLTLRAQAYVIKGWAAADSGDMQLAHQMYCQSLLPETW